VPGPRRRHGGASFALVISKKTSKNSGAGGVFAPQLEGLRAAQRSGYGQPDSGAPKLISSTTAGAGAAPRPAGPGGDYRRVLWQGIRRCFSNRSTPWTNMPIQRFRAALAPAGQLDD